MTIFAFIALALSIFFLAGWSRRRQARRLLEENAVRQKLGLPPLTKGQFDLHVYEKSADFRCNINQHM